MELVFAFKDCFFVHSCPCFLRVFQCYCHIECSTVIGFKVISGCICTVWTCCAATCGRQMKGLRNFFLGIYMTWTRKGMAYFIHLFSFFRGLLKASLFNGLMIPHYPQGCGAWRTLPTHHSLCLPSGRLLTARLNRALWIFLSYSARTTCSKIGPKSRWK